MPVGVAGVSAADNAAQAATCGRRPGQKCSEEARPYFVAFSRWASCETAFTGKSTSNTRWGRIPGYDVEETGSSQWKKVIIHRLTNESY